MKKLNMIWTKVAAIALGAVLTLGIGVTLSSTSPSREVEAATTETRRIWVKVATGENTWFNNDGARLFVHLYGSGTNGWPGQEVTLFDSANAFKYFDAPNTYTNFIFTRVAPNGTIWKELPSNVLGEAQGQWFCTINTGLNGYIRQDWVQNSNPNITTNVANFVATIDTQAEACSTGAAQAAVNAYNALSTFEQDQFDSYSFGSPAKTGLQTLNYLRTFYSISTPLNANWVDSYSSKNIAVIITIALLGVTSLAGFYFLRKKKAAF